MKPTIRQAGGSYQFSWLETGVSIAVSALRQEHNGEVKGELHITREIEGRRQHINQCRLNFLAPRSKTELVNTLTRSCDDVLWGEVIEQLVYYTLDCFRLGEPVLTVSSADDFAPPSYLIQPLVVERHPNMVFGDPGTAKSLLGLVTVCLVSMPWPDNPLGFSVNGRQRQVGYLDWETDEHELGWRLKTLTAGMGLGVMWTNYRRCALSFADDLAAIEKMVLEKNIEYLILDSLGPACGGDLTAAEPALRLFACLRQLKVTSLILAHESKGGNQKKPTAYGSIFFTALARSIWRSEVIQEVGDSELVLVLRHTKANTSKRNAPRGFRLQFGEAQTTILPIDLAKVPAFLAKEPLPRQVQIILKRGQRTVEELLIETGAEDGYLRKVLTGMKKRGEITNPERGTWGLIANVTR